MSRNHTITVYGRTFDETRRMRGFLRKHFSHYIDNSKSGDLKQDTTCRGLRISATLTFRPETTYCAALHQGREIQQVLKQDGCDTHRSTDEANSSIVTGRYAANLCRSPR